MRFFGEGLACKVRHPRQSGKNRVLGFRPDDLDLLDELVRFYREERLHFTLSVSPGQTTFELFQRLVQAGLWSAGGGTVPALVPTWSTSEEAHPTQSGIYVRRSGLEEREIYLNLFQEAFAQREESAPEYRAFQWAEDALPQTTRYIAEIEGKPVGMASFPILDGIGYFGTAGVIPKCRGRGVQGALIRQRIADAPDLGCDLVLAGGSPGTTTYRNFERAGFRLIPTGSAWRERPT